MQTIRPDLQAPTIKAEICKLTLAIQEVGHGHSGKSLNGAGKKGFPPNSHRPLL